MKHVNNGGSLFVFKDHNFRLQAPVRQFQVYNPITPPVSEETLDFMAKLRDAGADDDPSYQLRKLSTKRAIQNDMRNSICQEFQNKSPSSLYRNLKSEICAKIMFGDWAI